MTIREFITDKLYTYMQLIAKNKQELSRKNMFKAINHQSIVNEVNKHFNKKWTLDSLLNDIEYKSIFNKLYYNKFGEYTFPWIADKLLKYVNSHLNEFFNNYQFEKDKDSFFKVNTTTPERETDGYYAKLCLNYFYKQLLDYYFEIGCDSHPVFDELFQMICDGQIKSTQWEALDFKIRKHIIKLNKFKRNDNARAISELKDNIGDTTTLDYDIAIADHHRDKPIVITRIQEDNGTLKDIVVIGNTGESHGAVTCSSKWKHMVGDKYYSMDEHWCQAYLLGRTAFFDMEHWAYIGYTKDKIVNILKKQPQIDKVYVISHKGNEITRLAKKLFNSVKKYKTAKKITLKSVTNQDVERIIGYLTCNSPYRDIFSYDKFITEQQSLTITMAKNIAIKFLKYIPDNILNAASPIIRRFDWNKEIIRDIIKSSQFDKIIYEEINEFLKECDENNHMNSKEGYDPKEFYLKKDKIGDTQYSKYNPINFSQYRTSPIIVINDEVITKQSDYEHHSDLIEQYEKKYNIKLIDLGLKSLNATNKIEHESPIIKDSAVGSVFGKVVLLESIQGNKNNVKNVLKNHGYAKVYLAPEISYGIKQNLYPYERVAKVKNRLFKLT